MNESNEELKRQLEEKNEEIVQLRKLLQEKELSKPALPPVITDSNHTVPKVGSRDTLDNPSIARYSRQLILPELGVKGQVCLQQTSVLIVGCGGLGCPAAVYLAAAGIGRLGLVDYDEVDLSNLHRQILHTESRVNQPKSASAAFACNQLNSSVECIPYHLSLDRKTALELISQYDIVVDATDNVASRYLLNDACVLAKRPLVSGSALRFEGQLTVYNHCGGPCYRCLFPRPPPPETVTNCSDGGVLGVVPGIIGSLQALEAIKIAANLGSSLSQKLLLFDASDCAFRTIRLRPRQPQCVVCGDSPSVTELQDYEQFCGAKASDKDRSLSILGPEDRIKVKDYAALVSAGDDHVLVDVRQPVELEICQLPGAINIPIDRVERDEQISGLLDRRKEDGKPLAVFVVCRRGNDSQLAVRQLQDKLAGRPVTVRDIQGGLTAWARQVDADFPVY